MRGIEIVEANGKRIEIPAVLLADARDQILGTDPILLSAQHDRCAVAVVGTHVQAAVTAQALETHPDIRLDVLHQMPEMDRAVGVRKRARDENCSGIIAHGDEYENGFETGAQGIT